MFDDGWQERLGIGYGDLQWAATGERLTAEAGWHELVASADGERQSWRGSSESRPW